MQNYTIEDDITISAYPIADGVRLMALSNLDQNAAKEKVLTFVSDQLAEKGFRIVSPSNGVWATNDGSSSIDDRNILDVIKEVTDQAHEKYVAGEFDEAGKRVERAFQNPYEGKDLTALKNAVGVIEKYSRRSHEQATSYRPGEGMAPDGTEARITAYAWDDCAKALKPVTQRFFESEEAFVQAVENARNVLESKHRVEEQTPLEGGYFGNLLPHKVALPRLDSDYVAKVLQIAQGLKK